VRSARSSTALCSSRKATAIWCGVTGRLAKNPSFWTKRVDIIRTYGRIAGIRVPLSIESVAQVRIAGPSAMTMTYRYDMVNGRTVTHEETTGD